MIQKNKTQATHQKRAKMYTEPIRVLLVEDDPDDALLLKESLTETSTTKFSFIHADSLFTGLKCAVEQEYDVILLDLNLPDSGGISTLTSLIAQAPQAPIVVLTGLEDEELSVKVHQIGAQDYIVKGQANSELLPRAIRYAIERQRLLEELESSQQREREARELASLELITHSSQTSITEQSFGVLRLQQSAPEYFNALVKRFEQNLEMSVEKRILKITHNVEEELLRMAEQLGSVKAGPRDVIDIYLRALKNLSQDAKPQKAQVLAEEGRLLVLGLMGNLVSFYRKYYSGSIRNRTSDINSHL
jgi:DNA-binding response OmpR family regulator